ncbi:MAG: zinc-ribbon domain containing protein [Spirochaetota bacterium]
MRKKKKSTLLYCPCCQKDVDREKYTQLVKLEEIVVNKEAHPWRPQLGWAVAAAQSRNLQWACDPCLKGGVAKAGRPWLQLFCDLNPYFAYTDKTIPCVTCKQDFIFSKAEQIHWYEKLQFWVQSVPKNCPTCRKKIRQDKNRNTEISEIVQHIKEDLQAVSVEKILQLVELYVEIDKIDKAKYYLSLARKKAKQVGEAEVQLVEDKAKSITTSLLESN